MQLPPSATGRSLVYPVRRCFPLAAAGRRTTVCTDYSSSRGLGLSRRSHPNTPPPPQVPQPTGAGLCPGTSRCASVYSATPPSTPRPCAHYPGKVPATRIQPSRAFRCGPGFCLAVAGRHDRLGSTYSAPIAHGIGSFGTSSSGTFSVFFGGPHPKSPNRRALGFGGRYPHHGSNLARLCTSIGPHPAPSCGRFLCRLGAIAHLNSQLEWD